jgi:predicted nucleotidyltransferase
VRVEFAAMDLATVSEQLRTFFAARKDVVAAYLFGSVARGDARATSDVDVGVLLARGEPETAADYDPVFRLQEELADCLGREVDVVVMNGAPLDLLHRVLRDGVRVHDGDPLARMEFELRVRTQYFDFLPLLLRYRATVLRRA